MLSNLKDIPSQDFLIQSRDQNRDSQISNSSRLRPQSQYRLVLALDTAADDSSSFEWKQPFDGFYVEDATDSSTEVKMGIIAPESQQVRNYVTLKQNDSAEYNEAISGAFFTWSAQASKTITIVFFMGVKFRPGSLRSFLNGGVTPTFGSGATPQTRVQSTAMAGALFTADADRKMMTITNMDTANTVYISGTSAVTGSAGTKPGIPIAPGQTYEWQSQAACYAICDAGLTAYVGLTDFR